MSISAQTHTKPPRHGGNRKSFEHSDFSIVTCLEDAGWGVMVPCPDYPHNMVVFGLWRNVQWERGYDG